MKVLAIILSGLLLQTSASFFDELRGAVSSVESSFGKLLTDVIYDVRETIDCTLMAVEQVLAVGVFRDPSDYDERCLGSGGTEVAQQPVVAATLPPPPLVPETRYITLPLMETEHKQVDSSMLDVDQVLCDILKKDNAHVQLKTVKLALLNETERLTEISELLKKQLAGLSAEVKEKFKSLDLQTSEPSVESISNDIKLLHEIEHNHKNTDDASKICRVLDKIVCILNGNEEDRTAANDLKIQEIMRKLNNNSKGGDSDSWQDIKDYPKDFRDYAKRVFDGNRSMLPPDDVTTNPEANHNKEGEIEKKDESNKKDNVTDDKPNEVTTVKPKRKRKTKRRTTTTTEKPLTIEELAAEYGSLFDVMPDIDSIEEQRSLDSAKSIIEESQLNEAVMNSLADLESSNEARDVF